MQADVARIAAVVEKHLDTDEYQVLVVAEKYQRQASRQPHVASISPESGQPTVLAIPAMRVMPVIGPRASLP